MRTVKITSDGSIYGTKILLDGVDISSSVVGVTVTMNPHSLCLVNLDLIGKMDIELPAEVTLSEQDGDG